MKIDGRKIADEIKSELKKKMESFNGEIKLAIISVGDNPASKNFLKIKNKFGQDLGVEVSVFESPINNQNELISLIKKTALTVDGVIVQLPLPQNFNVQEVLSSVPPEVDIDALGENTKNFLSPIALAIKELLKVSNISIVNKKIVVLGAGFLVGRPIISWLESCGETFQVVDINTAEKEKGDLLKTADIIITGIGNPHFIKKEMIKAGVVIIDAGTSELGGSLVGDMDPECESVTSFFTPVPGGVGPVTVAMLYKNLIESVCKQ